MRNPMCRIPNKLCRHSTLKKGSMTPHFLRLGLHNDFLPKSTVEKEGKILNCAVEKLDKHYLSQVIKVNTKSQKSCYRIFPLYNMTENGTSFR